MTLTGCGDRRAEPDPRDAELTRLSDALTATQQERDILMRENRELAAENERLKLSAAQSNAQHALTQWKARAGHSHAPDKPPALPAINDTGVSNGGGPFVVVLASVGARFADQERPGLRPLQVSLRPVTAASWAKALATAPRSGGLQLIYGLEGMSESAARSTLNILVSRYADAFVLNTD